MRMAIISDIHSNYEALTRVLDDIKISRVDKIFCCGDIIGYGPSPNECIMSIRSQNILSIIGNHEAALLGYIELDWFNENAKQAILKTKAILEPENLNYLKTLPKFIVENDLLFVHGSPLDPTYEYLIDSNSISINIKNMQQKICFCGHTHVPFISWKSSKEVELFYPKENFSINLNKNKKYIINVGAVGQPRDLNPKACYVVFDTENFKLEFKRLDYNFHVTQQKMSQLQLPEFLIRRIEFGE